MFKQRLAWIVLVAAAVFAVGLLLGLLLPRWAGLGASPRVYNTSSLLQQVQTLSQLVTVKYVIEKVEVLEDPSSNVLRQFLPDNTRVILVAHGIVKAGIDFSQMKPGDIKIAGTKAVVKLPRPQITDAYLDEKQTQVIEHTTGFLRSFNKDLEQNTRLNALDNIRRSARSSGILKDADERARFQLNALLRQFGVEEVEYQTP